MPSNVFKMIINVQIMTTHFCKNFIFNVLQMCYFRILQFKRIQKALKIFKKNINNTKVQVYSASKMINIRCIYISSGHN